MRPSGVVAELYTSAYLNHGIRRIVIFDYDLHHGEHHFYVSIRMLYADARLR